MQLHIRPLTCLMYERLFVQLVDFYVFCNKSVLRQWRTGGISGLRLILSVSDLRFFAPSSHRCLWLRSLNWTIMSASCFWLKRWHALKLVSVALATPRCWRVRTTQLLPVSISASPALPLTHCIVSDHFCRWTPICNVCSANDVATFSTWDAKAGRLDWQVSSRCLLLKLMVSLTACTSTYTVASLVNCV